MEGSLVWLTMARAPGVGRVRLCKLMEVCPDPADAWLLTAADLQQVKGWTRPAVEGFLSVRRDYNARRSAELELERAQRNGLRLVARPDPDYPVRLTEIPDPPPYFYQAGPWQPDDRPVVAVVGTRKPTAYGLSVAERLGRDLAREGAVVVSGMARGIDLAAHQGALEAGGTTVAVLASGADICYPREAGPAYRAMRETGAVISENPPGTLPTAELFPDRNRIISGLAKGIVVVEAGERSGTLLTVTAATEQGRDVFAVPGPITSPMSIGPNQLLHDGAGVVISARQVLDDLGFTRTRRPSEQELPLDLTPDQERLLGWMGFDPRWAGDLVAGTGITAREVQSILTFLELRGLVRQLPGGQYVRVG